MPATFEIAFRTPVMEGHEDTEGDGMSTVGHIGEEFPTLYDAVRHAETRLSRPRPTTKMRAQVRRTGTNEIVGTVIPLV
jgi:hypothetical protein